MPFVTDFVSRVGGREHNEDYCGFLEVANAVCWVVADGLGGHRGGETASRIAVEAVLASFRDEPQLKTVALQRHLEAAQQAVVRMQMEQPGLSTMRTTIVVLITDSSCALWGHVGDSRLYCLENGRVAFRTSDHSVVQMMVAAGDLSPDQIRHHEDRNRLLRCLGNPDGEFRPTILPEPRTLYRGTAFLLCTDGFWDNVTDAEMEVDCAKADSAQDWLTLMEDRLLERTTEGDDNYTAMAVTFDSEAAPPPPSALRTRLGTL
jgi:PPM family protein phosphatase